jgi:hypothetical protein
VLRRERAITELRKKLDEAMRENAMLRRRLEKLKQEMELKAQADLEVVKVIQKFTREEVLAAKEKLRLGEGDVVYITDTSGAGKSAAEELALLKPRAIIADMQRASHLAREALESVVILEPEEINLKRVADFAVVEKHTLEELIQKKKAKLEVEQAAKKQLWLEKLIADYRAERELLLKKRN